MCNWIRVAPGPRQKPLPHLHGTGRIRATHLDPLLEERAPGSFSFRL